MDVLQIVAEPRRREILRLIWSEELAAGDIAASFDVTFGAVSQHLRVLRDAGLVHARRDGTRRLYRADTSRLGPLEPMLSAMWAAKLDSLAEAIEEGTS